MSNAMYKKSNRRQPRQNSGWKKKSGNKPQAGKRRFSGGNINVNMFVNKAGTEKAVETYVSQNTFGDFPINDRLKQTIMRRGFSAPTPIQDQAIPHVLSGQDVIGLANTGTGKTAAFLIPMIDKVTKNQSEKVLVVVPTRELAIQIQEEFLQFAQGTNIFSVVVVGGANIQPQIRSLRARHNFVIGTPGRLKDLVARKNLNLSQFGNIILDEADRMLDMGFINDIKYLMSLIAKKRQTLLFSATFGAEIENLTKSFLVDPKRISIKSRETSHLVDQDIVRVPTGGDKIDILHDLLNQSEFEKVLVFTRTKHGADKLSHKLYQRGFSTDSIHGDKPHNKRQRALKMFKENKVTILVATDVAARGLDIPNVSHVINFDVPETYDDYVHRIGRTGRAEKKGIALTFIS